MTKQEEKRLNLKRRLEYTLWVDRDFDGTWPLVGILVKYGGFGYNCFRSEKPLWWVTGRNVRLIENSLEMYELLKEELIPTSNYGGIISFECERKIKALLARIDGEEMEHD